MGRDNDPVIIGAAQYTQREGTEHPLDPLRLMERVCREAMEDSGAQGLSAAVDRVWVVNEMSWPYRDAPGALCRALSLSPREALYSSLGGNTPQRLVNQAARLIARGEARAVLITGAEAQFTARRVTRREIAVDWPPSEYPERTAGGNDDMGMGTSDLENSYYLMAPINTYCLLESAVRAAREEGLRERARDVASLLSGFSRVAAENPHAWSRRAYTPEEILAPSPENRLVCPPYTRRMCANLNVDQAAALVVVSEETARSLGVPREKWVVPMGGADLANVFYLTERPRLDDSPALARAVELSLAQAGITLSDVDLFDLYSCFPSMVEISRRTLGLSGDDPRPLTVTGGLPFFGGPLNNYSMHAIVTAVSRIREKPGTTVLVQALGLYNTKHSVGVYGSRPPASDWAGRDDSAVQAEILSHALPPAREKAEGPFTVEAYVILLDRTGAPMRGTVLGRTEDHARALADLDVPIEMLAWFIHEELVGKTGRVRFDPRAGHNLLAFPVIPQ